MKAPHAGHTYRFFVMFGGITIHALALALPVFMMQLYDRILPNNAVATLTWLAVAAVTAIVLEAALRTARQTWAAWYSERALYRARRELVAELMGEGVAAPVARRAFEGLRVLTFDTYQQKSFFLSDLPFGLLYLGLIDLIHPYLALTLVGLGLLLVLYHRGSRGAYAEVSLAKDDLLARREAWMEATFGAMAEWKALGAEEQMSRHHRRLQDELRSVEADLTAMEANKLGLTKLMENLAVFGPLILGGALVIEGRLTVGALTAAVLLARRALGPLVGLAERVTVQVELQRARRSLFRAIRPSSGPRTEVKSAPEIPPGPQTMTLAGVVLRQGYARPGQARAIALGGELIDQGADEAALRLRDTEWTPGTWVRFPDDLGLPFERLFRALRGFDRAYSGTISLGGQDLSQWSAPQLSSAVCLVNDETTLFPGTFLDNLSLFDPSLRDRSLLLASRLGLDPVFEGLDRGYETPATDRLVASLAPGVRQRLALVRGLVRAPKLVILDRIDTHWDDEDRRRLRATLNEQRARSVVLYRGADPGWASEVDLEASWVGQAVVFGRVRS